MEMLDFPGVFNTQVGSLGRARAVKWTSLKKFADGCACPLCMLNFKGKVSQMETRDPVHSFIAKAGPAYCADSVVD